MNILISGASGFIGSALKPYLESKGHQVYLLHRGKSSGSFYWLHEQDIIHLDESITIDAVINLNGVNIGEKSWNKKRKQALIDSRVKSTQLLSQALVKRFEPPKVLINASAIGYYGDTRHTETDESSKAGNNFLTDIVKQWEAAALPAVNANIRTVFIRSGIVLANHGGALQKMLPAFKFGLGGKIGNGQQYMSWISLTDELRAIAFLLDEPSIQGPVNLTAPHPVTNRIFSQTLAAELRRPCLLPLPSTMIKLLFGEMGELLLLGSNRVLPSILTRHGFQFQHKTLAEALNFELKASG
ncbi:TIGR01777 family oxidoreductase [Oceaniserpentilla sp. 4NH20-0058]|uniref:TIGR01777 family oxidoreductase n=1 Tax=Oceaniserpentilla sp. 4NH20-0058 TaxID=3127660 RepID=UPI00310B3EAF